MFIFWCDSTIENKTNKYKKHSPWPLHCICAFVSINDLFTHENSVSQRMELPVTRSDIMYKTKPCNILICDSSVCTDAEVLPLKLHASIPRVVKNLRFQLSNSISVHSTPFGTYWPWSQLVSWYNVSNSCQYMRLLLVAYICHNQLIRPFIVKFSWCR